jgi:hypothetical protein
MVENPQHKSCAELCSVVDMSSGRRQPAAQVLAVQSTGKAPVPAVLAPLPPMDGREQQINERRTGLRCRAPGVERREDPLLR